MKRTFKTADYDATLEVTVRLGDCLPPDHLARFVVDTIAQLDLSTIYARYSPRGGQPYAPEILLAVLRLCHRYLQFAQAGTRDLPDRAVPLHRWQPAPRSRHAGHL